MRNDARPIGEDAPASPLGGDERPMPSEPPPAGRDADADRAKDTRVNKDTEVVSRASEPHKK
jgi:hypothetical protein